MFIFDIFTYLLIAKYKQKSVYVIVSTSKVQVMKSFDVCPGRNQEVRHDSQGRIQDLSLGGVELRGAEGVE